MRKYYIIIIVLLLSLPLLGNAGKRADGIALKNFPAETVIKSSLSRQSVERLGEIILLPDSPFDDVEAFSIISRIDSLPASMLKKTNKHGIKIKLFTGKLTDHPTTKHLRGVTPRGYVGDTKWDDVPGIGGAKTVLVKIGASEKGNGHGSVNLELHELAHSIDRYVYGEIRHKQDFLRIWEQECGLLFPGNVYFGSYPEEYFAEAFAMYFLNEDTKETLHRQAIKTFEFIRALQ